MFLTRVRLNPKRQKTRELLRDRYVGHALVESCTNGENRTLWCVSKSQRDHVDLYMYTQVRPSAHALVEQCGWPEQYDDTVRTEDCSRMLAKVQPGDTFRFSVNVSPQRRSEGVSSAITNDAGVRAWFTRREEGWGFSTGGNFALPTVGTAGYTRKGRTVPFASSDVTGTLTVTDADKFRAAVTGGLGRTKHAGFGMLLLSPLPAA